MGARKTCPRLLQLLATQHSTAARDWADRQAPKETPLLAHRRRARHLPSSLDLEPPPSPLPALRRWLRPQTVLRAKFTLTHSKLVHPAPILLSRSITATTTRCNSALAFPVSYTVSGRHSNVIWIIPTSVSDSRFRPNLGGRLSSFS